MKKKEIELSKNHYQAQAAIIWCYDHRAWSALLSFLKKEKIKDFDLISIAGGAKSLASPDKKLERGFVLDQIKKSILLHQTKKVILMNHSDCGGYGGIKKFNGDFKKELKFHQKELEKAKKLIKNKFPSLKIQTIFVEF